MSLDEKIWVVTKTVCQSRWCDDHCSKKILFWTRTEPTKEQINTIKSFGHRKSEKGENVTFGVESCFGFDVAHWIQNRAERGAHRTVLIDVEGPVEDARPWYEK